MRIIKLYCISNGFHIRTNSFERKIKINNQLYQNVSFKMAVTYTLNMANRRYFRLENLLKWNVYRCERIVNRNKMEIYIYIYLRTYIYTYVYIISMFPGGILSRSRHFPRRIALRKIVQNRSPDDAFGEREHAIYSNFKYNIINTGGEGGKGPFSRQPEFRESR